MSGHLDPSDLAVTLSTFAQEVEALGHNARWFTQDELRDSIGGLARWASEILADLDA